jgi:hypothetical protein
MVEIFYFALLSSGCLPQWAFEKLDQTLIDVCSESYHVDVDLG